MKNDPVKCKCERVYLAPDVYEIAHVVGCEEDLMERLFSQPLRTSFQPPPIEQGLVWCDTTDESREVWRVRSGDRWEACPDKASALKRSEELRGATE